MACRKGRCLGLSSVIPIVLTYSGVLCVFPSSLTTTNGNSLGELDLASQSLGTSVWAVASTSWASVSPLVSSKINSAATGVYILVFSLSVRFIYFWISPMAYSFYLLGTQASSTSSYSSTRSTEYLSRIIVDSSFYFLVTTSASTSSLLL